MIHQTGEREYNEAKPLTRIAISAEVHTFIDDMPAFFARADLVVVPLGSEHGRGNRGRRQACHFCSISSRSRRSSAAQCGGDGAGQRGGRFRRNASWIEVWLVDTIDALIQDPARLEKMSDAAREMSHPDAAKEIAEMAAKVAGIENSALSH